MRLLWLFGCALVLASCHPISNRVNPLEIQCGPSETEDGLVKILNANGQELEAEELTIFRRDGEVFSPVAPTRKGCFAYDSQHDYIVNSKGNQGLTVPRGQDVRLITLRDVQTSELGLVCPTMAVSQDFDLGESLRNAGELDGFALDLRLTDNDLKFRAQSAALVARQDYSLKPFRDLPDGRYSLEIRTQNLLKNLPPRTLRCDIRLDSTAPQLSLEPDSFLPRDSQGFTLIEPTAKIRFKTQDNSRTEILSCWVPQKESMLAPQNTVDCPLKPLGSEISPPSEGYWTLVYQAVDEAGQRSPLMQQPFMVYQGGTLRELSLEMELTAFLFENNQNLRAVTKTLAAETRRRKLPTAFEQSEAEPAINANLYQMSPNQIPYLEKKVPSVRFVSVTPDGSRTIINQLEPGNALIALDSSTGQELWRAEHPNGRMQRVAFTADSKRMISSGALSGELLIWSTETGEILKRIPRPGRDGFENKVFDIFLAANDRFLGAAGFDDVVLIYDLAAAEPTLVTSVAYDKFLLSLAFSPSGERFVTTSGKSAFVYQRDGTLLETVTREDGQYVSAAAFLSEDELVLSSIEQTDRENRRKFKAGFFYARLGETPLRLASIAGNIDKILPSPDRKHFVAIGEGSNGAPFFPNWREQLHDPSRGERDDLRFATLNGKISTDGAYWTTDSRVLTTTSGEAGVEGMIRVQSVDGAMLLEIASGSRNAYASDQGTRLVNYQMDGRLEFWNLRAAPIDRFALPQRVQVAKYAPDASRFYTIEESGTEGEVAKLLRVWDRASLKELGRTRTTASFVNTLMCSVFLNANELVFPLDQHRIQSLNVLSGTQASLVDRSEPSLIEERGAIISFAVSQDGQRLALGYAQGFVEIVDLKSQTILFMQQLHQQSPYQVNGDMFGKAVSSIDFRGASHDVVSAGQDGQLFMLTPNEAGAYASQLLFAVPEIIYHVDLNDDFIAIAARFSTVIVYQFSTGQLTQLPLEKSFPYMADLNSRQNILSVATFAGDLVTFNLADASLRHRIVLKRGLQESRALSISADGGDILTAVQGDVLFIPNSPATLYERFCRYLAAMQICPSAESR
ncbi:MAG TPA: WD40 repeat domain-containing protein [Oligoflexus sp.]|uniref:WD40 repeat domain-containing protein n=1 Tax=Oligoflexus sp. TaxID=1971216 RepID=UPI002D810F13|nr:WD40 repeat domain-containing protein [Oligoflexus sp.]HET9239327.1 WD40 repeat domain-containing protein [Oligoflexus sp.]